MTRILTCTLLLLLAAPIRAQQPSAEQPPAADQPADQPASDPAASEPSDAPADAPPAAAEPSPEAAAAKQAFDALQQQWLELVEKIGAVQSQRRAAEGAARAPLDQEIIDLRAQADD